MSQPISTLCARVFWLNLSCCISRPSVDINKFNGSLFWFGFFFHAFARIEECLSERPNALEWIWMGRMKREEHRKMLREIFDSHAADDLSHDYTRYMESFKNPIRSLHFISNSQTKKCFSSLHCSIKDGKNTIWAHSAYSFYHLIELMMIRVDN